MLTTAKHFIAVKQKEVKLLSVREQLLEIVRMGKERKNTQGVRNKEMLKSVGCYLIKKSDGSLECFLSGVMLECLAGVFISAESPVWFNLKSVIVDKAYRKPL